MIHEMRDTSDLWLVFLLSNEAEQGLYDSCHVNDTARPNYTDVDNDTTFDWKWNNEYI